ncbi:haloacid dehalogenase type II [Rhodobacterales bacterium HKCCE2091]|nr:haloacid dehalogenase type II [Rhodobacterales bacterium HKCCE2091]
MSAIRACVFDAYGTLFDVNAAAREVAGKPGHETFALVWQQVAQDWRAKTLQYTWLRTITGDYVDFWKITEEALDWALEASDQAEPELRELLLGLFWSLKAYPEVRPVLQALKDRDVPAAILSNGTKEMLAAAVDTAGVGDSLAAVMSVEDVGTYKPAPQVYDLVGETLGLDRDEVLFVSSNGWDAAGAAGYGFDTLWVNRAREPVDRLPGKPRRIAADLRGLPGIVAELQA